MKRKFIMEIEVDYPDKYHEQLQHQDGELFHCIYAMGLEDVMYSDNANRRLLYDTGLYKTLDNDLTIKVTENEIDLEQLQKLEWVKYYDACGIQTLELTDNVSKTKYYIIQKPYTMHDKFIIKSSIEVYDNFFYSADDAKSFVENLIKEGRRIK